MWQSVSPNLVAWWSWERCIFYMTIQATCNLVQQHVIRCDRAAECASFQSGRHHCYSLVDSTPTTKEEPFEMPPCSSSAGFSGVWAGCRGLSPSHGRVRTCTLGLWWCHGFRRTIVLGVGSWSKSGVFCACSVVGQIAVLRHAVLCLHLWMRVPS